MAAVPAAAAALAQAPMAEAATPLAGAASTEEEVPGTELVLVPLTPGGVEDGRTEVRLP